MDTVLKSTLLFSLISFSVRGQDCKVGGEYCIDTKDCCGGCCMGSACIDIYFDCHLKYDPCQDNDCPPNARCDIYQPDCKGCPPEQICIDSPDPPVPPLALESHMVNQNETNGDLGFNNGSYNRGFNLFLFIFFSCLVIKITSF